jgi:peptidoglycan/LPS O-acetylase OafA/YrhL
MIGGGEISYSIYLLHPFVLSQFAANLGLYLGLMGIVVGSVLVISYITWALIEVPSRRWVRDTLTRAHHRKTIAFVEQQLKTTEAAE